MTNSRPRWQTVLRYVGWIALAVVALVISCGIGGVIGLVIGETRSYHRRYLEERELCAPIVAADPAFARITIHQKSNGGIYLGGEVSSEEVRERLAQQIAKAVGERRAQQAMLGVETRTRPPP